MTEGGTVLDALTQWFFSGRFPLHDPAYLWAYLISDAVIGLAYYSIPVSLIHFARKRDVPRKGGVMMFTLFVFACGTTHFLAIWSIWHVDYRLDTVIKVVAALASIAIAVQLWPLIPRALLLPHAGQLRRVIAQLEHEIEERKKAEEALRQSQATLRELAAYQERIREDERKRIAREIHDELGQNLLALRLDVSGLHARAGERHPQLQRRAATALDYIDTTLKSIRAIMNNLRPSVLDLGLPAAIEWQVRQFEKRNSVPCDLVLSDDGLPVPELQATAAFRILQESLNNIGRHACATHVRVELRIDDRQLVMAIKDNGVGMYPHDRRKARRFGLIGVQERITMLDGELTIDSSPGRGTVLRIRIPLQPGVSEPMAGGQDPEQLLRRVS